MAHHHEKTEKYAGQQKKGCHSLDRCSQPFITFADKPEKKYHEHGQQHFTHVYIISKDRIAKAELKNITHNKSCHEGKGSSIGPYDGDINKDKKP